MNVPQETLDGFAQTFRRLHVLNFTAWRHLRAGRVPEALAAVEQERGQAWRGMQAAIAAGAATPPEIPTDRREVSLAEMTSPANRRLLAALRAAVDAAEAVDRERGDWPDGLNEPLADFAARVAAEVEGPRGSGRE